MSDDKRVFGQFSSFYRTSSQDENTDKVIAEMRANRRVNAKTAAVSSGVAGDLGFATGRPRDPIFYWRQNNLPYDFDKEDELRKIRKFLRLLYITHPILASCVDIFSKYPILGLEITSKDDKITDFYSDLFLSPDHLNYEQFLIDMGREFWLVGEAFPFATFNESLGIWQDEELLNPDKVTVHKSPFMRDPTFFIGLPDEIQNILDTREPAWEYQRLVKAYPKLLNYSKEEARMPVSNVLLKQLRFTGDTFNPRGIPLAMRAMRAIIQEEMLNSAMDAIADRLYTPLILVKLGASASDLGTQEPWVPTQSDTANFREALDTALAADFRAIVSHFATDIESVFGREQMPDLTADFDRLEERILQSFGLSKTLLSGAEGGETYAADALNKQLVTQLLTTYQRMLQRHFRDRAAVVAEAQEHYDYEVRNGKRYVIMEEVLEIDEETGEERIVKQPKLLIPELRFRTMDLKDEQQEHDFMEQLRSSGVPISMETRLQNLNIDFEEELEKIKGEQVSLTVAEMETQREKYVALNNQGLPIPQELKDLFEPRAQVPGSEDQRMMQRMYRYPTMGEEDNQGQMNPNLAPTLESQMMVPLDDPTGQVEPQLDDDPYQEEQRPEESDEMRQGMPSQAQLHRNTSRIRRVANSKPKPPGVLNKFDPPPHIGKRKELDIDPDKPLEEWEVS